MNDRQSSRAFATIGFPPGSVRAAAPHPIATSREYSQRLSVRRVTEPIKLPGCEIGDLAPRGAIERLHPYIRDPVFQDRIGHCPFIRREHDRPGNARIGAQGAARGVGAPRRDSQSEDACEGKRCRLKNGICFPSGERPPRDAEIPAFETAVPGTISGVPPSTETRRMMVFGRILVVHPFRIQRTNRIEIPSPVRELRGT